MRRMTQWISPSGLLLFSAFFLWTGLLSPADAARRDGRIGVTVIDRTTQEVLPDQTVVLRRHRSEDEQAEEIARKVTDRRGRAVFTNLPVDSAHYVADTRYLDVDYASGHIELLEDQADHDLELSVYDTTAQDTAIRVEAHHQIIEATETLLDVTEILVFRNGGARTFVPAGEAAAGLRLPLPSGAFQIQPMSAGIVGAGAGLAYTAPVPPGQSQVVYAYQIDRKSIDHTLRTQVAYDTERMQVLITPSTLTVASAGLHSEGVRRIGERDYLLLTNTSGLQRGMTFEVRFPRVFAWQELMRWGFLGLVVLIVIAGVAAPALIKTNGPAATAPKTRKRKKAVSEGESLQDVDDLIREIADLDDRYEAGELDEKTYRRRRQRLKDRAIKRRMAEDGDG